MGEVARSAVPAAYLLAERWSGPQDSRERGLALPLFYAKQRKLYAFRKHVSLPHESQGRGLGRLASFAVEILSPPEPARAARSWVSGYGWSPLVGIAAYFHYALLGFNSMH